MHVRRQYNSSAIRMNVVLAQGALLDRILDETFELWNEGLSRSAYARWNLAQLGTPWGRERLHRFALVDDAGGLLATAKLYRHDVRLDGRDGWMAGIGALFTPADQRGRGYASQLIERLLDRERREGALLASLFSAIGPAFYERLGFSSVTINEVTVRVERRNGAPAMLVRVGDERDLPAVSAMHDARSAGVRFTLQRDPSAIHYALSKKRLLAGLGPQGLRQVEFVVAEEGASAVAYAVLQENANGWTLEDAGDRDPSGARLGAILQLLMAREPSAPAPLIRAWWPAVFPVPPQLELVDASPARDLFMVRPLTAVSMPEKAGDVFYWHGDHF
jgi:GNAT superfamily N-acetyltransferase